MTKRLFLLSPAVVFTARANQTSFQYPITQVEFDGGVALGTVVEDMTVVFGTTAGASDLGRQRVRAGSTLGATGTLNVGRSSPGIRDGELYPANDCYITVWDDFRVWAKIPLIEADGTIYKDSDVVVGTKTANIPPKANIEPPAAAGDIATGTNVMTVELASTGTYALSGTISSYLWDVGDGTITVGTSASSAITATFPAGFRWISLTVTDSNANTHMVRAPVYARDPASDTTIKAFQIEQQRITTQGQELSLKITESIPEGTYPDGTLVMLWDDDLTTITDGSHMTFVGWHHVDPAQIEAGKTALLSNVTLDCLDLAGKLKTLPGFPISVEGKTTPASWLEMSAPNMDKYIDYIMRWHSTALELGHFTLSGTGSDYPFVILASDASSLWEQAARRAQSLVPDYVLVCDTNGRIAMKPDPIIAPAADRTFTVQTTIDESEWSGIRYTRQRAPRVHWLRSEAILASATQVGALFCVAPDNTPGQGVSSRTHGEQLARNQFDLNVAEGHRYARLNAFESHFNLALAAGHRHGIEPAHMTWVQLTMSAATAAQRGLDFTNERGLVHEINISHRYGREGHTQEVSLTWERETVGTPAQAYFPPTTGIDDDIPYEPDPDPGFDPDPAPDSGTGLGTLYVMVGDALGRTRNAGASSPAWVEIAASVASTYNDFILDPWAPATTGYLGTAAGIYKSTDLDQVSPTWTLMLSKATIEAALSRTYNGVIRLEASINFENYVIVFLNMDARTYTAQTSNGGSSWTYSPQIGGSVGLGSGAVVPHAVAGNVRAYVFTGDALFRSDNGGASWSLVSSSLTSGGKPTIDIPYKDNPDGSLVYVAYTPAFEDHIMKSIDGGATWSEVLTAQSFAIRKASVGSYTLDNEILYAVERISGSPDKFITTTDGFASTREAAMGGLPASYNILGTGGFPFNGAQFYMVTNTGIYISFDRGETWIDKTGDWAFGFSVAGGAVVIVPLWTE